MSHPKKSLLPTQITLLTNETCNFRCRTCFAWTKQEKNVLSLSEIQNVLIDLKAWLGAFRIEIAGGEVFLRKDIGEILRFTKSLGIHISLVTNGSLINKENAQILVETCDVVNLSLNGLFPETHDYMRGVEGAHALMMTAIENLNSAREQSGTNTYFNIMCILSDHNKHEVIPLLDWAETKKINGFCAQAISHPFWMKYDPEWKKRGKLWPKTKEDCDAIVEVVDTLISRRTPNVASRTSCYIGNTLQQLSEMKRYFQFDPKNLCSEYWEESYYLKQIQELEKNSNSNSSLQKQNEVAHSNRETAISTQAYENYYLDSTEENNRCKIGYHNIIITFEGNVNICHTMKPIGNIREDHIKNIWFGEKANGRRKEIKACEKGCKVLLCNSKQSENDINQADSKNEQVFAFGTT